MMVVADKSIAPNAKMWMVRSEGGLFLDHFLNRETAEIGWGAIGPISSADSDHEIRQKCKNHFPSNPTVWHQIRRFAQWIAIDDAVITYSVNTRVYHVGIVTSDAEHIPNAYGIGKGPGFSRHVNWSYEVQRDSLSPNARNKLGANLTVFQIDCSAAHELFQICIGKGQWNPQTDDSLSDSTSDDAEEIFDTGDILKEYIAKSDEFVEDTIANLGPFQLQELVAGILRAMGYRTKVSAPGPDRGVDISASPDGLGLSEPRIFVEVKHKSGTVSSQAIRAFLGGRRPGDRCLYVSTGGFSKDAQYEADRSPIPLTLLTLPSLRELLIDNYEILDPATRALVPLKKVYWPVEE